MIKEFDNIKYSKHQLYSYKQCLLSVYIFQHEEERREIGERGSPFIDKGGPIFPCKKYNHQQKCLKPHDQVS